MQTVPVHACAPTATRSPESLVRHVMSLDLDSLLDLPDSLNRRRLTLVTSDDLNNSSFAFHSFIQSKVKSLRSAARLQLQQQPQQQQQQSSESAASLILVCLNQSYSHYASVAAKSFGLNLKSLREQGTLKVIDIVKDVQDYGEASNAGSLDVEKLEHTLSSLISSAETTTAAASAASSSPSTCLIMIDDVRVLCALGIPVPRVHLFIDRIRSLASRHNGRLVIQSNMDPADERCSRLNHEQDRKAEHGDDDEEEDDEWGEDDPQLRRLLAYLISCADVWIDFQKLRTGFSDKIDGSLFLYDFKSNSSRSLPVRYHFKTLERSTRIYTPGSGFV